MTPKEKAEQLFEKFYYAQQPYNFETKTAKQCALIAVDCIITDGNIEFMTIQESLKPRLYEYWVEVRREIEKL